MTKLLPITLSVLVLLGILVGAVMVNNEYFSLAMSGKSVLDKAKSIEDTIEKKIPVPLPPVKIPDPPYFGPATGEN